MHCFLLVDEAKLLPGLTLVKRPDRLVNLLFVEKFKSVLKLLVNLRKLHNLQSFYPLFA